MERADRSGILAALRVNARRAAGTAVSGAVAFAMTVALAVAAHAGTREGLGALDRSDYRTALRELTPPAEQGDAAAQAALGRMYLHGWGVPRDPAVAAGWLRRAAEQGDAASAKRLAALYSQGSGVPKDPAEAKKWEDVAASAAAARAPKPPVRYGDYENRYVRFQGQLVLAETALMRAIERRDREAVEQLLRMGADVDEIVTFNGPNAAIHVAAIWWPEIIGRLLDAGANPDARTGSGGNALVSLLAMGNPAYPVCASLQTVRRMVERGATVNLTDSNGRSPLNQARAMSDGCRDKKAIVQLLVDRGAKQ